MAGPPPLRQPLRAALAAILATSTPLAAAVLMAPPDHPHHSASAESGPTLAQRTPQSAVPMQPGEDYRMVRRRLLARGWRPRQQPAEPGCSLLPDDRRCTLYPELASCAMTGLGLCRFDWIAPAGVPYAVITRDGSADGRPGLIERWFVSR